ncbi:MAG: HU family DNA-binding protein [bacterium]
MTKAEWIDAVAKTAKADVSKAAVAEIVDAAIDQAAKEIKKSGRFAIPGFGTFTVRKRKGRMGRNPRTGQPIQIKPSKTVGFKPAPDLKKKL